MAKRDTTPGATVPANQPVAETAEETAARIAGKGAPTPTRREQEAARKRPLVPDDRKEAARQARQKTAEARERARVGMAAGDDKYLTARDRGPQRRYVRDYVDARFNIGEFMIPVMLLVIVLTFFPQRDVQTYGIIALWAFFVIAVLDCFFLGYLVRKGLATKFGKSKVEKGVRWYAAMRALQLRVIRLPKPQVKRGQYPS
ncbi:DUF3043 domain-containing protein [Diaminobutyricibacter tongyongensis]|uniref:DUF3043 domain-containing protein n=1 Tax=Leifsonia tongyongensis TaxID=1268043 RepID=A0A6L9XXG8_9MICO|nr:DUF3043 domain-containing protein [Diaminobutyricibacter tongyongensis]